MDPRRSEFTLADIRTSPTDANHLHFTPRAVVAEHIEQLAEEIFSQPDREDKAGGRRHAFSAGQCGKQ
jgi:hypothetical protein